MLSIRMTRIEKDRYEAFEKDNGVVKVVVSRARERDIHYMV